MRTSAIADDRTRGPSFRWGAIVAGAIWGLALMAVLTSMWLALAYRSGIDVGAGRPAMVPRGLRRLLPVRRRTDRGIARGPSGAGAGFVHGMTAWALLLVGTLVFGVPSVFGLFDADRLRTIESADLVGARARATRCGPRSSRS